MPHSDSRQCEPAVERLEEEREEESADNGNEVANMLALRLKVIPQIQFARTASKASVSTRTRQMRLAVSEEIKHPS